MVMFSSSTGRFGRTGQVDYAVANEVLNKIAQQQAGLRPACRVLSLNWGPWDGGMVTPALKQLFADEGIAVIDLNAGADYLVREIATAAGGPVELEWMELVDSIMAAYLAGQASGSAVAELLAGVANPSGKLAETFPIRLQDNPSSHYFPQGPDVVEYRESIFVGYRYYDKRNIEPLFPFGHGLSYTSFALSDLRVSQDQASAGDTVTFSIDVENTGSSAGAEVVQIYVSYPDSEVERAERELKGFSKVWLERGERRTVSIDVPIDDLAYYDSDRSEWVIEALEYMVHAGTSSRDLPLSATVSVDSEAIAR